MVSNVCRPTHRIALRVPVLVLVLAATAIPVELRPLARATLGLGIQASDVVANIAGYVPVGIVLGDMGVVRAVIAAALISTFAEASQFGMMHRDPSVIDVVANVIGAILGTVVSMRRRIRSPEFRLDKWKAAVAATLAFALVLGVWASSGDALNGRGSTSPGTLEAHWQFDETGGRFALDSSGHALHGKFRNHPRRVDGVMGGAVRLDGAKDYVDFGHSTALRLVGSMTISAWINSSSFPVDDAAIVSQLGGFGYQLDTTVDHGLHTIGFKLTNACGDLMARYGATPLVVGRWYYVAGVYDAEAQTLDVYLNGELDNGFLLGSVTGTQHSSRSAVYVGRRSDSEGFEFAGSIDDVRIYSFVLTNTEIAAGMRGRVIDGLAAQRAAERRVKGRRPAGHSRDPDAACAVLSDPEDARTPGAAAALGVLAAAAVLGLWPSAGLLFCLIISCAAGLLLVHATASTLPPFSLWVMLLVTLAGGASVAFSVRRHRDPDLCSPWWSSRSE